MKRFVFLLFSLSFSGCFRHPDPNPEKLQFNYDIVDIGSAAGEEIQCNLESNSEWRLRIPASANWVQINEMEGSGNTMIRIKAISKNMNGKERSVEITAVSINDTMVRSKIVIMQRMTTLPNGLEKNSEGNEDRPLIKVSHRDDYFLWEWSNLITFL